MRSIPPRPIARCRTSHFVMYDAKKRKDETRCSRRRGYFRWRTKKKDNAGLMRDCIVGIRDS